MNDLLKRYVKGEISPDEIEKLRDLPDPILFDSMREDWENFSNEAPVKKRVWRRLLWSGVAAVVALLIISTITLWNRTHVLSSQDIIVSTRGNGERANVTLPDGSTVILNSNSSLSYKPEDFSGNKRSVMFEGEGYFSIAKKENSSFTVHTSLIDVNVKGTTFNLLSRDKEHMASLYLETGSVELKATGSGESIELKPGEFVRLDSSGLGFILENKESGKAASSWRRGEYMFINRSLTDVVKYLEYNTGTKIKLNDTELGKINFTGTLPAGDMLEALKILELSCGLNISQTDDSIILSAK